MLIRSFLILLILGTFGCARYEPKDSTEAQKKLPILEPKQETMEALAHASFYGKGDGLHGKKTASGERFNANAFTAAHRTLPFGTIVKVTNPENNKSVEVRINDRGPWIKGREIDLSYSAAKKIGITGKGIKLVKIEVIKTN